MTNQTALSFALTLGVLAGAALLCVLLAQAQTVFAHPKKPTWLIVPFPAKAGGGGRLTGTCSHATRGQRIGRRRVYLSIQWPS